MRRRNLNEPFAPFVFLNPYRFGGSEALAAAEMGDGYLCLEYQMGISQVVLFAVKKQDFPDRYTKSEQPIARLVVDIKAKALDKGATLEAIQLLGQLLPLTKTEEATMAENKLTKKTGDAAALKAAAKAAPVDKKKAAAPAAEAKAAPAKKGGNADALKAAREARAGKAAENRKYKVLVKAKDLTFREGSWTLAMAQAIVGNTTTDGAREAIKGHSEFGDRRPDFKWAEDKGLISF